MNHLVERELSKDRGTYTVEPAPETLHPPIEDIVEIFYTYCNNHHHRFDGVCNCKPEKEKPRIRIYFRSFSGRSDPRLPLAPFDFYFKGMHGLIAFYCRVPVGASLDFRKGGNMSVRILPGYWLHWYRRHKSSYPYYKFGSSFHWSRDSKGAWREVSLHLRWFTVYVSNLPF